MTAPPTTTLTYASGPRRAVIYFTSTTKLTPPKRRIARVGRPLSFFSYHPSTMRPPSALPLLHARVAGGPQAAARVCPACSTFSAPSSSVASTSYSRPRLYSSLVSGSRPHLPSSDRQLSLRRAFGTSASTWARQQDHYAVLKLPRNATKQQVKARFYEVSLRCLGWALGRRGGEAGEERRGREGREDARTCEMKKGLEWGGRVPEGGKGRRGAAEDGRRQGQQVLHLLWGGHGRIDSHVGEEREGCWSGGQRRRHGGEGSGEARESQMANNAPVPAMLTSLTAALEESAPRRTRWLPLRLPHNQRRVRRARRRRRARRVRPYAFPPFARICAMVSALSAGSSGGRPSPCVGWSGERQGNMGQVRTRSTLVRPPPRRPGPRLRHGIWTGEWKRNYGGSGGDEVG